MGSGTRPPTIRGHARQNVQYLNAAAGHEAAFAFREGSTSGTPFLMGKTADAEQFAGRIIAERGVLHGRVRSFLRKSDTNDTRMTIGRHIPTNTSVNARDGSALGQKRPTVIRVRMSALGLGRVKTPPGMKARLDGRTFGTEPPPHALIAAISGLMPMMFMTRVRL